MGDYTRRYAQQLQRRAF